MLNFKGSLGVRIILTACNIGKCEYVTMAFWNSFCFSRIHAICTRSQYLISWAKGGGQKPPRRRRRRRTCRSLTAQCLHRFRVKRRRRMRFPSHNAGKCGHLTLLLWWVSKWGWVVPGAGSICCPVRKRFETSIRCRRCTTVYNLASKEWNYPSLPPPSPPPPPSNDCLCRLRHHVLKAFISRDANAHACAAPDTPGTVHVISICQISKLNSKLISHRVSTSTLTSTARSRKSNYRKFIT